MYSFFVELTFTLGILIVLRLFIFYKKSNTNTILLALAIFCICYGLLINFLNETGLIFHFPHLFRTAFFLAYLVAPLLYIRQKLILPGNSLEENRLVFPFAGTVLFN